MFILENGVPTYQIRSHQSGSSRIYQPNMEGSTNKDLPLDQDPKIAKIKSLLLDLDVSSKNSYAKELKDIKILVRNYSSDIPQLKKIIQKLHLYSLENTKFCQKYAILCGELANFEISGLKVRYEVLLLLQSSFEDTTLTRTQRINYYELLGEIFYRMKISDGSPIKVLASPIIKNLQDILENYENHIYLFAIQMTTIGKLLNEIEPREFEDLLLEMRKYLIKANFNSPSKIWLLIAFDICDNNFQGLNEEKLKLYEQVIDPTTLDILKAPENESSNEMINYYETNQEQDLSKNQYSNNKQNMQFSQNFKKHEKTNYKKGRSILGKGEYTKNKQ